MYQMNMQLCLEFQNSISLPFEHDINEANSILLYGSPISTITFLKEWNLLLGSYTLSWYTCVQTEEPCELQYTGIMSSNCHTTFTHKRTRFEELKQIHTYMFLACIWQKCLNFPNKNVCVNVSRLGCLNVNLCSAVNMLTLWPALFRPRTCHNHR